MKDLADGEFPARHTFSSRHNLYSVSAKTHHTFIHDSKSNFLSSEIYSQHSLLPSSNQDLHRFLALEFPLQTSKSPGMHVISFLNIIYSPVNEQHHIN